ncbi:unnamed protein product, partial [Amoebophrya sp. A25]
DTTSSIHAEEEDEQENRNAAFLSHQLVEQEAVVHRSTASSTTPAYSFQHSRGIAMEGIDFEVGIPVLKFDEDGMYHLRCPAPPSYSDDAEEGTMPAYRVLVANMVQFDDSDPLRGLVLRCVSISTAFDDTATSDADAADETAADTVQDEEDAFDDIVDSETNYFRDITRGFFVFRQLKEETGNATTSGTGGGTPTSSTSLLSASSTTTSLTSSSISRSTR